MTWVLSQHRAGTRKATAQIPESVRREVTRRGEELVARKFAPLLGQETPMRMRGFNYAVAIFTVSGEDDPSICVPGIARLGGVRRTISSCGAHGWNMLAEAVFTWRTFGIRIGGSGSTTG